MLKILFYTFLLSIIIQLDSFTQELFLKGADISFLQKIEDYGGYYLENGNRKDLLDILKNNHINLIRLRIWHTPAEDYNNLQRTINLAKRIKQYGFKFLLDFHYSDTWADPANQTKPAAWQMLNFIALKDSVYAYTKNVLLKLKAENLLPDYVQIGNEISGGLLWNDGRVLGVYNTDSQWVRLSELIMKGVQAVKEVETVSEKIKIIIHTDKGGDFNSCSYFFDKLLAKGVQFDIIGLSYYPWWHGSLNSLQYNLNMLSYRYDKDIIILETAYPWTLNWNDNTHNVVGLESQLLSGYPATPAGQKSFLTEVLNLVNSVPNEHGVGVVYWEPDWISLPGFGSAWENLSLFDFSNNLLNSISAFEFPVTKVEINQIPDKLILVQNYPNPFNSSTIISLYNCKPGQVNLKIFNLLGEEVEELLNKKLNQGKYSFRWDAKFLPGGTYFLRLQSDETVLVKKFLLIK